MSRLVLLRWHSLLVGAKRAVVTAEKRVRGLQGGWRTEWVATDVDGRGARVGGEKRIG